jgi:uncharacterized protein (TIGR00106 family)
MHQHTINASIQLIPVSISRHAYDWVDEAIGVIQRSGIKHEVTAFGTIVEGSYPEVMEVIHQVQEHLLQIGCEEWISQIQIQIRKDGPITGTAKTEKFR